MDEKQGGTFSFRLTQAFGSSSAGSAAQPQLTLPDPPMRGAAAAAAPPGVGGAGGATGGGGDGGGDAVAGALLRASWTCLCAWPSQPDVCANAL